MRLTRTAPAAEERRDLRPVDGDDDSDSDGDSDGDGDSDSDSDGTCWTRSGRGPPP
jgi:hypothetical protein